MGLFHGEPGTAGCKAIFAASIQVGSDSIRAGLQACGVNLRGSIASRNFHTGAIPAVFDRTLGIEIRPAGSSGHGLARKNFCRLYRASRAWRRWRLFSAKHEIEASL